MKLNELPKSIYHTLRLANASVEGLLGANKKQVPVIVSFTSIPSRLEKVHIVVRCLFDQAVLPTKIVLWLHESLAHKIPSKLANLEGDLFEIRYTPLHVSHKKLIHTLDEFPESIIVTCDDDFIYHRNWLQSLYEEHLEFPNTVVANHVRTILFNKEGQLLPYKKWIYSSVHEGSNALLAIGGKGVLYPVHALDDRFDQESLFMELAPKADDLWFKAMEYLKGTPIKLTSRPVPEPFPIAGTQSISLKNENIDYDRNTLQWQALQEYFKIDLDRF